jgi:uridine kinase
MYLDFMVYCMLLLVLLWFSGIFNLVIWFYHLTNKQWMEIMYVTSIILVIGCTGYIFKELLDEMEKSLFVMRDDRKQLLQQNMDLQKENKEIKMMFKRLLRNVEEEDKVFLNRL